MIKMKSKKKERLEGLEDLKKRETMKYNSQTGGIFTEKLKVESNFFGELDLVNCIKSTEPLEEQFNTTALQPMK